MRRESAAVIAVLAATGILGLGGCGNVAWWGAKKAAKEEAREMGEKVGITKTKEELRQEIEDEKQECRRKEEKLHREMEKQRDEYGKKEAELKQKIDDLKAEYERKIKELEKR